jgi:hypothetical protein
MSSEASGQQWARKMFKEYMHDFGTVKKGEVPEHRFEIQNVFEEDIRIVSVRSSCGCTSVSLSKNVLKTWEKGEVICRFNSPAFDGFKQATITVRFDRPFVGEVQLMVRGNIVRGVNFTPSSIDFGQVSESNLPTKKIQLSHAGSSNFRVLDVKSTFSHIKVQLRETARMRNQVNYEMTTQLKPTVPRGFSQGELYVVIESNRIRQEIPIKFSAKVVSALQIPEQIALGTVAPGEEVKKRVVLKCDRPFRITDVTCQSKAFKVKADKEAKKVHFVEVIYVGEDKPGHHECELSFFTDLDQEAAGKTTAIVEIISDQPIQETADASSIQSN